MSCLLTQKGHLNFHLYTAFELIWRYFREEGHLIGSNIDEIILERFAYVEKGWRWNKGRSQLHWPGNLSIYIYQGHKNPIDIPRARQYVFPRSHGDHLHRRARISTLEKDSINDIGWRSQFGLYMYIISV